jgi:Tol biopolymer transport system component
MSLRKSPSQKLNLTTSWEDNQVIIIPNTPLKIGEIYQLIDEDASIALIEEIRVREPCLVYIGNPGEQPEIWRKCAGKEPERLTQTGGGVQDLTVSLFGDWIFYSALNDQDEVDIWRINRDGGLAERIVNCGDSLCSEIESNSIIRKLAYLQNNTESKINILDFQTGNSLSISTSGADLSFSPDGQYLSYFDNLKGQLTIINLSNMKTVSQDSGMGLVGEWSMDSHSILFGKNDFWGGIPGVDVYQWNVEKNEVVQLFNSRDQELEFYQPAFSYEPETYLVSVRQRSSGFSKQLWLIKNGGEIVKQITNDYLFHYSCYHWNSNFSEMVFQRYPVNESNAKPQVLIWHVETETFEIIAEDAAKPFWLP